jgi:kumamolisin
MLRNYLKRRTAHQATSVSYYPDEIAKLYNYPAGDGTGQTVDVIELGGGFVQADLNEYCAKRGVVAPQVEFVSVDGATNTPDGPNGADGEVMSDLCVTTLLLPKCRLRCVIAPNTTQGFADAIRRSRTSGCTVMSISWGGPENTWSEPDKVTMDTELSAARESGITILVAAGDNGASDGEAGINVDYPASSPHVVGCGGTRLRIVNGVTAETVWNDGTTGGATGGGISSVYLRKPWQPAKGLPGGAKHRCVPDVAGNADPDTGYNVRIDGGDYVIGGTSLVAPMWAALVARINQNLGKNVGFFQPALYAAKGKGMRDITVGNNGLYVARVGYDCCTGMGVPDGVALQNLLK